MIFLRFRKWVDAYAVYNEDQARILAWQKLDEETKENFINQVFQKYSISKFDFNTRLQVQNLCQKIITEIRGTPNLTISNMKGLIYCQCTLFLFSYKNKPNDLGDCNNPDHPFNGLLYFIGELLGDLQHKPMQEVLSMIGTSLIIQTMLPFVDIQKDFNSIEAFFLKQYA